MNKIVIQVVSDIHLEFYKTYPKIVFESFNISQSQNNLFIAQGKLQIKNIKKDILINFELSPTIEDTWKYKTKFVKFSTSINRNDFNLKWNKTIQNNDFLVGENLSIFGQIQLQLTGKKTPQSFHKIPDTQYIREREKLNRGEMGNPLPVLIRPKTPYKEVSVNNSPLKENLSPVEKDSEKSIMWWLSLFFMGLIGFSASIIVSLFSKEYLAQKMGDSYIENKSTGLLTDVVAITILVLYSICFWVIGWGDL